MKLYINDAPMGECRSYEQVREAARPGWLFHMETGLNFFICFDEIQSFTSCGELRITEKTAKISGNKCATCAHNLDKTGLNCEAACAGATRTRTDNDGTVYITACVDYEKDTPA